MVTLWVDPHLPKENPRPSVPGKKRKGMCAKQCNGEYTYHAYQCNISSAGIKGPFFVLSADNPAPTVIDEDEEDLESSSYNARLSRLREKHGKFPEFKLQCWARMLVRNIKFSARLNIEVG